MFVLHTSKTHNRSAKPQIIKISCQKSSKRLSDNRYCPFKALQHYIGVRKKLINNEEFFIFIDRTPVLNSHFRSVLVCCINWNKLNSCRYSSQSFRAGRSSDLLELGLSVEMIKKLGRWKSSAVYTYL